MMTLEGGTDGDGNGGDQDGDGEGSPEQSKFPLPVDLQFDFTLAPDKLRDNADGMHDDLLEELEDAMQKGGADNDEIVQSCDEVNQSLKRLQNGEIGINEVEEVVKRWVRIKRF